MPRAGRLVEERRRGLLDDLLVAALDRAFALAEIDDVAVLVAQHLDLDVARIGDELLDEDAVVAEGGAASTCAGEALAPPRRRRGDAHALAAAAGRGLDHHRVADLVGDGTACSGPRSPRKPGTVETRGAARLLGLDLVAHGRDGRGFGPMKAMPSASACGEASRSDRKP
jgi:hypothetical protein